MSEATPAKAMVLPKRPEFSAKMGALAGVAKLKPGPLGVFLLIGFAKIFFKLVGLRQFNEQLFILEINHKTVSHTEIHSTFDHTDNR